MNIPILNIVCNHTWTVVLDAWNTVSLPIFGWYPSYFMNCSRATFDVVCVLVTGPLVGTPDCSYCVVNMLPALHMPAFYYLRGSWVRRLVTSVFVLNLDRIHMICFGYLCGNVFVLYFMLVVLGGRVCQPVVGWGGPFHRFVWFLRLVSLLITERSVW